MGSRWRVLGALASLTLWAGACTGGTADGTGSGEPSATPPSQVAEAYCEFVGARGRLAEDDVGMAYHAAYLGDLDQAITVTEDVVQPSLATMAASLDTIAEWQPGQAFASHARPMVAEFAEAASEFVAAPDESTFDRADVAGQTLRDDLFAGAFSRVGLDVFHARCDSSDT